MIQYIIAAGIGAFLGSQSKKSKKSYAEGGSVDGKMSEAEKIKYAKDSMRRRGFRFQVEDMVKDLSPEEYEVFADDNDIDLEDANEMEEFIWTLSEEDAKKIIKQLRGSYAKGGVVGFYDEGQKSMRFQQFDDREETKKFLEKGGMKEVIKDPKTRKEFKFYAKGGSTISSLIQVKSGNKGKMETIYQERHFYALERAKMFYKQEKDNGKSVFLLVDYEVEDKHIAKGDEESMYMYAKGGIAYVNDDFPELVDSQTYVIDGTYGSNQTPTEVYVMELEGGGKWYAARDSVNVNYTNDSFYDGVDIETISDIDTITASKPIEYSDDLEDLIVRHYGEMLEERGDDYYAKGGKVKSKLIKDLDEVRNKFTDLKLKADLHTEKGVAKFRKKAQPLKNQERKIEAKLTAMGQEAYILPFAKGGKPKPPYDNRGNTLEDMVRSAENAHRKAIKAEQAGVISTTQLHKKQATVEYWRKKLNNWYASRPIK